MMKYLTGSALVMALVACSPQSSERPSVAPETRTAEIPLETARITAADLDSDRAAINKKAALELLAYQEGAWDSKWEWLGPNGDIVGTMEGVEEFKTLVDDHSQLLTNTVPAFEQTSYAMLSYNPVEQKIIFMNVGDKGDYWIMRQDPETGTMKSDPHANPDGTTTLLKFTTLRQDKDSMDIQMESSSDGGNTWAVMFNQYMVRKK